MSYSKVPKTYNLLSKSGRAALIEPAKQQVHPSPFGLCAKYPCHPEDLWEETPVVAPAPHQPSHAPALAESRQPFAYICVHLHNLGGTQQSSSKLGSVFVCTRFAVKNQWSRQPLSEFFMRQPVIFRSPLPCLSSELHRSASPKTNPPC